MCTRRPDPRRCICQYNAPTTSRVYARPHSNVGHRENLIARTRIKALDEQYRDYRHYRDMGWFESDYYWPAPLGLPQRGVGKLFDVFGRLLLRFA